MTYQLALLLGLLAATAPAQTFPRLPGYNIGLNPTAAILVTTTGGQPALWVVVPGSNSIATFYDPATLPIGTVKVSLSIAQWGVYESMACAAGAKLYFDTQNPLSTFASGTVTTTGWNVFGSHFPLAYATADRFHSTWYVSYCNVMTCTNPCGMMFRDPVYEAYLFVPTFS